GVDLRPALARAVVQRGWPLLELRGAAATLETVFISLVTREDGALAAGATGAQAGGTQPVAAAAGTEGTDA
ncbi:MAG TPA: ABC transporter ATP-binding protein, partial [Thermodesulfobacteriota bacterium]|nr:ABC transporter ATP-binding protein [Thermodesulfobacteriota bacterium]